MKSHRASVAKLTKLKERMAESSSWNHQGWYNGKPGALLQHMLALVELRHCNLAVFQPQRWALSSHLSVGRGAWRQGQGEEKESGFFLCYPALSRAQSTDGTGCTFRMKQNNSPTRIFKSKKPPKPLTPRIIVAFLPSSFRSPFQSPLYPMVTNRPVPMM